MNQGVLTVERFTAIYHDGPTCQAQSSPVCVLSFPRSRLYYHRSAGVPSASAPPPKPMYRKFFSPSFVMAEGHTLHSLRGSVRHAMDGTPPARTMSIFVLKDGGASMPEVPVPSMMMETARGYLVGDTPFW